MKLSIVVPAYNEGPNIKQLYKVLTAVLKRHNLNSYEMLFVNDGSTDDTLQIIKELAKKDDRVKYLSFTRNFGHQAAVRAGLSEAKGDGVISMDADLQHPPELIPQLVELWEGGAEIVYTRRKSGNEVGVFKKLSSKLFYGFLNRLSDIKLDEGTADFRLLDRQVVQVIKDLPEPHLFLRGFISWCGFTAAVIDYQQNPRFAGKSHYSLRKMVSLALHGVTQFSVQPLRIANIIGLLSAFIGVMYGFYAGWSWLAHHAVISGWTSVIISVLILGGIQLVMLGIMGEYLGKTFMQTKGRPDYIIKEKN